MGLTALAATMTLQAWTPAEVSISTPWSESVDPAQVWNQYPRPMLKRSEWKNLNGLWQYAIQPAQSKTPLEY